MSHSEVSPGSCFDFFLYFRAISEEFITSSVVKILHVDYGNRSTARVAELKALPPQFHNLSKFAMKAELNGEFCAKAAKNSTLFNKQIFIFQNGKEMLGNPTMVSSSGRVLKELN